MSAAHTAPGNETPNEPANNNDPIALEAPEAATPSEHGKLPEIAEATAQAEIARLTEELAKMRDQWIRAVAEADNIRKRTQRDLEENTKYAASSFAADMVSVLENLQRASDSIPENERASNKLLKTLGEGVDLTLQEMLGIFTQRSIARINPLDAKFDHNLHQAVAQVERDDVPAGTVVQVVQAGYTMHDRLLRPAMVVVSKPSAQ